MNSFKIILVCFLSLLLISIMGCESDTSSQDAAEEQLTVEADPHAGHDHGPGEHGVVAEEQFTVAGNEDVALDWCMEHSVPESVCTKCNPSLIGGFKETGDWCGGHDLPESHCRLCNPEIRFPQEEILYQRSLEQADGDIEVSLFFRPNKSVCATNDALIQFATDETVVKAGITVESVRPSQYEATITAPAETVFDETGTTYVTSSVPALVSRWLKSPGDQVRFGDALAILTSPSIAELKASLVAKKAAYTLEEKEIARHRNLRERDLISEADYDVQVALTEQARAEVLRVEGLLLSAGMSKSDIEAVSSENDLGNSFTLRSPTTGLLVNRPAQPGELLEAGSLFALIADPKAMWIEAELTEQQLRSVENGQQLTFSSDGTGLNRVGGEIIWKSQLLDPHSRTGTVRAKVLNPTHQLRAGEFGRATIPVLENREVTLIPKASVQWEGCCNVVFVKETVSRYRPRKVELLDGEGGYYQVSRGLSQGEEVVVDGAFLLKTELKKSSIGAGCCGIEPVG